ncbi:MAG TPA: ABC transporter ATP-binding protein [Alphaproteobacteria bacterium]|nr:ABC transporter ATP-binding protein [Alphaproteobacteria bacterium]
MTSAPQASPDVAIRLDGVTKWFFKNGGRIAAVEDVSLDVPAGSFVTLVGPSGCGKSTLFNCIAGFIVPEIGEVIYRGRRITKPNVGIGYMTQKDSLLPWRSVLANVMLPLHLQKMPEAAARARALEVIARVGLTGFADHVPAELSGGMQKRTALARMLAYNPDTLLMDEPFGNVDVQLKLQLQRELMRLWEAERKTVVFVTHDLEEALALSDRVVVLSRRPGRIKTVIEVDLPRPRDPVRIRFEPAFQKLHHSLWSQCDTIDEIGEEDDGPSDRGD